jgi:hypothetical protein
MWAFAVAVIGSLAVAFGKLGAMIHLWRLWAPESPMDWMTVTLFLLEADIAGLSARAATPEPLEDDEG